MIVVHQMPKTVKDIKTVEYIQSERIVAFHAKDGRLLDKVRPVKEFITEDPVLVTADLFGVSVSAPDGKLFVCTFNEEHEDVACELQH